MKQILYIFFFIISLTHTFGQAVTIQPNTFQLPKVSTNPACTVADKGKVVFNTTQNKILYCNGSAWIDPESGTTMRTTPAFSADGNSQAVRSDQFYSVTFNFEFFDLSNNFNLNDAATDPNKFIAPDNGIYEIDFNTKFDMYSFSPAEDTQIVFKLSESMPNQYYRSYSFVFPVRDNAHEHAIQFSKVLKLAPGARVSVEMKLENPPTFGTLRIGRPYFSGHLVSWL
ncbi:hypothetical protein [Emticicia agri]|uniref:C1q domain-containing protein n=1 Tax=Emticicia agri TaxID=2492393 RepID=A0A4Q5M521_9BACT|nr:hypothetical protein [Emticicia agri]RYU97003.1 hypothetical protein EWM59_03585 [Emticicia agri]